MIGNLLYEAQRLQQIVLSTRSDRRDTSTGDLNFLRYAEEFAVNIQEWCRRNNLPRGPYVQIVGFNE